MSVFHNKMMSFHTGRYIARAFWVALVVENPPATAGDARAAGSIPGRERSPGGGRGNPLQYSRLEHLMDRGAWWVTVHSVVKSRTQLKQLSTVKY